MKKFVIISNPYKDPNLEVANQIVAYIREKGGSAINLSESENGPVEFEAVHYELIPEDTECILVLGGDGTLIRVVRKTRKTNIPLIGVNLGTLGYLCELEKDTVYQAIDQLMLDNCTVEERLMIKGYRKNANKGRTALNDIVKTSHSSLSIDNLSTSDDVYLFPSASTAKLLGPVNIIALLNPVAFSTFTSRVIFVFPSR